MRRSTRTATWSRRVRRFRRSLEKLSSGFRINRAADDAAGLVKSENLRAEIGGTRQAIQNAQDGISFVQMAEGALNEVHSILQRIRDLAVSAANTATTDGVAQQAEIDELVLELTSISTRTKFAGNNVFADYSVTNLVFHVGAGSRDELTIADDLQIDTTGAAGVFSVDVTAVDVTTATGDADAAIGDLDTLIADGSDARGRPGATQNRLIMSQAGTAMLAQANAVPQSVLGLLRG